MDGVGVLALRPVGSFQGPSLRHGPRRRHGRVPPKPQVLEAARPAAQHSLTRPCFAQGRPIFPFGLIVTTPHLLLVGGGHAHVQVFRDFARAAPACRITVLADEPSTLYSGMVPGFVAGQYGASELTLNVAQWAQRMDANFVQGRLVGLDPERKLVLRAEGEPLPYDYCSLNIGSTVQGMEVPGVREFTLPTRPMKDFVAQVNPRLEAAHASAEGRPLRIVIVGGGAAGVELALCLQHRARQPAGSEPHISLVCSSAMLLPGSAPALRRRVQAELRRRGVDVLRGMWVRAVSATGVRLQEAADAEDSCRPADAGEQKTLAADLVLWVTGAASHLEPAESLSPRAWIPVGKTLQHVQHPALLAAGDCAQLVGHEDLAKAGVYSVRMGPVLAHNLRALVEGRNDLQSYTPQQDFLALLNLGDGRAAGAKWGVSFSGLWVMRWKDRIDRRFMAKFQ